MTKIRERLVVEVACDSTSLTFGFVREVEPGVGEFAVGINERRARGHDSSSFEYGPQQRQQRERQQDRERSRGPRERRLRHCEGKTQRL